MMNQVGWQRERGPLSLYSILSKLNTKHPELQALPAPICIDQWIVIMAESTTLTVRLNPTLSEFVARNVAADGAYDNVSEYVRDLIRKDMEQRDQQTFERLKAELKQAFSAPDETYRPLKVADFLAGHAGVDGRRR